MAAGQLPPGVGAALLDKKRPREVPVLGVGEHAPIYVNDVRGDATALEVVLTFALKTGGGEADPQLVREVQVMAMSWPMLEVLHNTLSQLLAQGMEIRLQALAEQHAMLTQMLEQAQAEMAEAEAQSNGTAPESPDQPQED